MLRRLFKRPREYDSAGSRPRPDRLVIEPCADAVPSTLPAVRIFLGTEPAQWRAERIFVWSILQVRDPSRRYEIYRMCDLAGFDRSEWATGFTNYRFAIPEYAGRRGRAIYNDVDQIYLSDPAQLFDLDMEGHGFLAISPKESSVMLIDCERLHSVWPLAEVQRRKGKTLLEEAVAAGLYGPCAPEWNARDEEYVAGRSHLLHYTTLHTQPWQPAPDVFIYQQCKVANVWHDLERSADDAGFLEFTEDRPSDTFTALASAVDTDIGWGRAPTSDIVRTVRDWNAQSLLVFGPDATRRAAELSGALGPAVRVQSLDPRSGATIEPCEVVACSGGFDRLPHEDTPWLLRKAFRLAKLGVLVDVREDPLRQQNRRGLDWWHRQVCAAADATTRRWRLEFHSGAAPEPATVMQGGLAPGETLRTWVLADDRMGNTTQSLGLAEQLGGSYEVKNLRYNRWETLHRYTDQLFPGSTLLVDRAASSPLQPPWPDLLIAAGRRTASTARWIRQQSGGRTKIVMLGRKGGHVADCFDLVVTPLHCRLPPHPRRIDSTLPLTRVTAARLAQERAQWPDLFAGQKRPRVVALIGGPTTRHVFDATTAQRFAQAIRRAADAAGASVTAITSRRTGSAATAALHAGLGEVHRVIEWKAGGAPNPYLACLEAADVLIVTGESESMLAEAAATGKPVYILALDERPLTFKMRLKERVLQRARGTLSQRRGTARVQRGSEYLCAWLISTGLVRPTRDLSAMHSEMVRRGMARMFVDSLEPYPTPESREEERIVREVRMRLGLGNPSSSSSASDVRLPRQQRATA